MRHIVTDHFDTLEGNARAAAVFIMEACRMSNMLPNRDTVQYLRDLATDMTPLDMCGHCERCTEFSRALLAVAADLEANLDAHGIDDLRELGPTTRHKPQQDVRPILMAPASKMVN